LVEEISQRELRNDNAEVIRRVLEGESFVVTRRGVPVARLVPLRGDKDLRRDRAARSRAPYRSLPRTSSPVSTAEALALVRDDR
jgi:prevent-host-death family protein